MVLVVADSGMMRATGMPRRGADGPFPARGQGLVAAARSAGVGAVELAMAGVGSGVC